MCVEGCWKIAFFWWDSNIQSLRIEKKWWKKYFRPHLDLIPGPLACKRIVLPLRHRDNQLNCLNLKVPILTRRKWSFIFYKSHFRFRFRVFVIYSNFPRGIWKISFYMLFYICIPSKSHNRSLLTFFPIGNPTLNCVTFLNKN